MGTKYVMGDDSVSTFRQIAELEKNKRPEFKKTRIFAHMIQLDCLIKKTAIIKGISIRISHSSPIFSSLRQRSSSRGILPKG